jgi:hypothetical protein
MGKAEQSSKHWQDNADHVIESQGQCHRHSAGCLVDLEVNNNPNNQDEQERIDYRTEN